MKVRVLNHERLPQWQPLAVEYLIGALVIPAECEIVEPQRTAFSTSEVVGIFA